MRLLGLLGVFLIGVAEAPAGVTSSGDAFQTGMSAVSLQQIGTLGCASCDGVRAITPTALAVLDDGRIAVLDRYEPFVRVFQPSGELDVTFGAKGQGPGDIGVSTGNDYLGGIFLLPEPGGGVAVMNPLPAALDSFDAEGTFVGRTRLDVPNAIPHAQAFSARSRVYFRHSTVPFSEDPDQIERCRLEVEREAACAPFAAPSSFIEPEYPAPAPLRPSRPALAATPDGDLVVIDPATYRIWILDGDGAVRAHMRRDIDRIEKTGAELEREQRSNERLRPNRRRPIDRFRAHLGRASVQVDGRSRLWILTERYGEEDSLFDVLGASGSLIAEVRVDAVIRTSPWHITPFVTRGDVLAAITALPDGEFIVNVYRIIAGREP